MFPEIKKNFGFGCMRLPTVGEEIDDETFCAMIDRFMAAGFNYFDTARVYHATKSEQALRRCLVERYPRESFVLTDKLSGPLFKTQEEARTLFHRQLETCGVDYFDFYLMHAQTENGFNHFKECRAYELAFELKAEGKIHHVGISFHDSAEVLDRILTEYPAIEVVQLQINYLDYDDPNVQGRLCLEVCAKHGKPVIVMEPVKGGNLIRLPDGAQEIFDNLHGGSNASYALRFAAGCPGVFMTLSGMSNMEQVEDNVATMGDYAPLTVAEQAAVARVCGAFRQTDLIPCTGCRYCTDGCPMGIAIPDLFSCMNAKKAFGDWNRDFYYGVITASNAPASACIECGACEGSCPQHLPIRDLLKDVKAAFEK